MVYIEKPKKDVTDIAVIIDPESKPGQLAKVLGMPLEYVSLVKDVCAKGATDAEFCLFLQIVKDTGLNPLNKEIWFYKMWDGIAQRELPVIHASIQGKRKAAERIGGYCPGRETEYKYNPEGYVISATAYVKRKIAGDWQEIAFTADWDEFAKYKSDGKTLSGKWATMPKHMLGKCAENHALNRAFPMLENIASTEDLPTDSFNVAFQSPPDVKPDEVSEEEAYKRGVLIEGLTTMGDILLDQEKKDVLIAWLETAPTQSLVEKHNTALGQFLTYAKGVYKAIPDAEKKAAVQSFNAEEFDDLGYAELVRFVYTFQKPIEAQEHPSEVDPPPAPKRERPKPKPRTK